MKRFALVFWRHVECKVVLYYCVEMYEFTVFIGVISHLRLACHPSIRTMC